MAKRPTRITIVSYQVGFGDCYLLQFHYDTNPRMQRRDVLIDFGRTHRAKRNGKKFGPELDWIANDIVRRVRGPQDSQRERLDAIVATHRHKDHVAGFRGRSGEILKTLRPKLVVQPWTEDPKLEPHATGVSVRGSSRGFTKTLLRMSEFAEQVYVESQEHLGGRRSRGPLRELYRQLAFLGEDNIRNKGAVTWLKDNGDDHDYLHYGSRSRLSRLLPGVRVTVLGPPTVDQHPAVAQMRSRDPEEYWHLQASAMAARKGRPPALSKDEAPVPQEARWFRDRLDQAHAENMLNIMRDMDDAMNNTSLILLFETGDQSLLFPGDAQIENWSYALFEARDKSRNLRKLGNVTVYKVGHHGSLNATPKKTVWSALKRSGRRNLTSLLSTSQHVHGSEDRRTEVPRQSLVRQLRRHSVLHSTDDIPMTRKFIEVEIKVK